ncbi:MAG: DmsC/YnfH family molybdoenzyme membrane anchor subunit [Candidatus Aminicenantes bacterium]|nr:DmsC/YnfH family molybdoenzyme membrane anchor subunit [Candidatus Aminicenantes bacterium]
MNERSRASTALFRAAFFWGLLWGIWEATAGHLVHLVKIPGLSGFIMFPAAFFFMSRAFARSERAESIFLAACVAASIKLFDLFIPGELLQAAVFTGLLGVLFLAAMSKLYMLRTVPAWLGLHTPLSFFLSALLLGPLAVAAGQRRLLTVPERFNAVQDAASVMALAAVALIVLTILLFTPRIGFLGTKKVTLAEIICAKCGQRSDFSFCLPEIPEKEI